MDTGLSSPYWDAWLASPRARAEQFHELVSDVYALVNSGASDKEVRELLDDRGLTGRAARSIVNFVSDKKVSKEEIAKHIRSVIY